jgi:hypothetical protein
MILNQRNAIFFIIRESMHWRTRFEIAQLSMLLLFRPKIKDIISKSCPVEVRSLHSSHVYKILLGVKYRFDVLIILRGIASFILLEDYFPVWLVADIKMIIHGSFYASIHSNTSSVLRLIYPEDPKEH